MNENGREKDEGIMKICYVTTLSSTIEVFILKAAAYIHDHTGWDISIICSGDQEFAGRLPEYIHYYPVVMSRGISTDGLKAAAEIFRIIRREKFDLVQYSTPNASFYTALAAFLNHTPVRLYCQWGIAYVGFSGVKRRIFKMAEKLVCTLSTHIEPDSKSNLRFSVEEGLYPENKGSVIWNGSACGVDLKKFDASLRAGLREEIRGKYQIPEDAFVYGFVGRITRDKGVNELLRAFHKLLKTAPNSYLLMVGPDEKDGTIQEKVYHWSGKTSRVCYTGFTNEVEKYISAMDVYILPSYREGFGMGVVEAEAMGVPVIVTDIPGPVDAMLPGKTGMTVEKKNVRQLYRAMLTMRESDGLRQMSQEAICFAAEHFEQQTLFEHILRDRKKLIGFL